MASDRGRVVEGSCWPCRRRRIKCDLATPQCGRCRQSQQPCHYGAKAPVRWVGGTARRGRYADLQQAPGTELLGRAPSPTPLDDEQLVLYFSHRVHPRFRLSDRAIAIDPDSLVQDPALHQAVLAVARAHHAFTTLGVSPQVVLERLRARQLALQSFRERLQHGCESVVATREILTTNVLLCMLDGIIEPSDGNNASLSHLKGGISILRQQQHLVPSLLLGNAFQTHALSVFATMDLVHAVLAGERPFLEPMIWSMFANVDAWWGHLPAGDRLFGLLKAFSEMAVLSHWLCAHSSSDKAVELVQRCLPSIQATWEASSPSSMVSAMDTDWGRFCSLYELSGQIFLNRALRQNPVDAEPVQKATLQGIGLLRDHPLPGMLAHCVIFPILVIGSHCLTGEAQQVIMGALSPSASYLSFGSLKMMIEFLKQVWQQGDVGVAWWDLFQPLSGKVFIF